jgi:hypothetical protein
MIKTRQIIFAALGAMIIASTARGQQAHTFTVQGGATVEAGNYAQAKSQGLTDAYKKAIIQALNQSLGEKTVTDKSKLVEEHFFQDPSKFVNRYKMLSEQFVGDAYTVKAEVDLSLEKISIELVQAGLDRSKNQSVMVVVFEEENKIHKSSWLAGKPEPSRAEKLLNLEIQRWGYRLVKPEAVFEPQKLEKNLSEKSWLSSTGEKYNAEFLVAGTDKLLIEKKEQTPEEKARVRNTEDSGTGVYAVTCQLEISLIDLNTGEKLELLKTGQTAADSEQAEAESKAIDQAVHTILPDLSLAMELLSRKGQAGPDKGQKVVIQILGVNSYFTYQQLMEGLKKVEGLHALELWGFSPGTVLVSVQYSGDKDALKTLVSGHDYGDFRILPVESEKQDLRFKFESNKQ